MAKEKSGLSYPNKMARIYLTAIEEMIGAEAMRTVLELANLPPLTKSYPPDNMSRNFDFADFSAVGAALETMYGLRGERGLGLHAGRASFTQGLGEFGSVTGVTELASKAISAQTKVKIGLKGMAEAFNRFSDQQTSVVEADDYFIYTIHLCPICWGRTSPRPVCYVGAGLILAGLQWLSKGQDFEITEVACRAMGDEACVFHIRKEPV